MSESLNAYPHVTAWRDNHCRLRWRFRRAGKTVYLPGEPFSDEFNAAYRAVLAGRPVPKKAPPPRPEPVHRISTATAPKSLRAAWRSYTEASPDWKACDPETRARLTRIAEIFLTEPIAEGSKDVWGDVPAADLKRRHVKMILTRMSDRPFAGRHRLNVIRKIVEGALDEEWIDADPTHKIRYRPERIKGFRPWTDEERSAFETHFAPGTTPRLVYEIALWLGNRRADVARLRWDQRGEWIDHEGHSHDVFRITQGKTGKMARWTALAGLPPGCTLHGLRKTLGRILGESDATTRQLMEVLGHDNIANAELYSREASQARLAVQGMDKVVAFENRRKMRLSQGG